LKLVAHWILSLLVYNCCPIPPLVFFFRFLTQNIKLLFYFKLWLRPRSPLHFWLILLPNIGIDQLILDVHIKHIFYFLRRCLLLHILIYIDILLIFLSHGLLRTRNLWRFIGFYYLVLDIDARRDLNIGIGRCLPPFKKFDWSFIWEYFRLT